MPISSWVKVGKLVSAGKMIAVFQIIISILGIAACISFGLFLIMEQLGNPAKLTKENDDIIISIILFALINFLLSTVFGFVLFAGVDKRNKWILLAWVGYCLFSFLFVTDHIFMLVSSFPITSITIGTILLLLLVSCASVIAYLFCRLHFQVPLLSDTMPPEISVPQQNFNLNVNLSDNDNDNVTVSIDQQPILESAHGHENKSYDVEGIENSRNGALRESNSEKALSCVPKYASKFSKSQGDLVASETNQHQQEQKHQHEQESVQPDLQHGYSQSI